jgi:hypothetical protein
VGFVAGERRRTFRRGAPIGFNPAYDFERASRNNLNPDVRKALRVGRARLKTVLIPLVRPLLLTPCRGIGPRPRSQCSAPRIGNASIMASRREVVPTLTHSKRSARCAVAQGHFPNGKNADRWNRNSQGPLEEHVTEREPSWPQIESELADRASPADRAEVDTDGSTKNRAAEGRCRNQCGCLIIPAGHRTVREEGPTFVRASPSRPGRAGRSGRRRCRMFPVDGVSHKTTRRIDQLCAPHWA